MNELRAASVTSETVQAPVDRSPPIVLIAALVSCVALMLPMLLAGPLVLDEYGTYWIAGDGPLTLWERSLDYENIPPLAPLINWIFFRIFGESEFVFRLPSALCYVVSVWLISRLGREIRNDRFGALLALVLAWHPVLLDEVRIARCYGLTLLLSIVVLWSTVRWLRMPESMGAPILWGLGSSAIIWTHYLNAVLVMLTSLVLAAFLFRYSDRGKTRLLITWLSVVVTSIPLWGPLVRMSVWGEYFGFQTETRLSETISSLWWAGFPAAFAVSVLYRPPGRLKPQSLRRILTILFFVCGIAPMLIVAMCCRDEWASLSNPRYRTSIEAAGIVFWVSMVTRHHSMRHGLAAVCAGILVCWLASEKYPWQPKRLNTSQSSQWKEMALHVESHGLPGQAVFVQSGLGEAALLRDFFADAVLQDYVACRMGRFYLKSEHRRIGLPFVWKLSPKMEQWYADQLKEIAASEQPSFWLAVATDTDLNESSSQFFEQLAEAHHFVADAPVTLPQARLVQFRLQAASP